jgi:cytochrome P450
MWDMVEVQRGLRVRIQMAKFLFLHRDKGWFDTVARVHKVLDKHIDRAYEQLKAEKNGEVAKNPHGEPRTDFLWTIARQMPNDKKALRSQLVGVFFPSSETTSILISNAIWALARHPRVVEKLRKEILSYGDAPLTWEVLRSMTYLRYVVNEGESEDFYQEAPT